MYSAVIRCLTWYVNACVYQMKQRRVLLNLRISRESDYISSATAAYFQSCGHLGSAKSWLIIS